MPAREPNKRGEYEQQETLLQIEPPRVQHWVKASGKRVMMRFAARDVYELGERVLDEGPGSRRAA